MALIIDTNSLHPADFLGNNGLFIYNALDCCITRELETPLYSQLTPDTRYIYQFERKLQAPVMSMMRRGVLVDQVERSKLASKYSMELVRLEHWLTLMAEAIWDKPLNPRSSDQLQQFFFDVMGLPVEYKIEKGVKKRSCDRSVLEKLKSHYYAEPIINLILAIKEIGGRLSVLRGGVDSDNRLRVSYNIGGTETGRWSSSKNAHGTGLNFQNITQDLRGIFISDPGMMLCYADLEQAESRAVAYLSGDEAYIEACESSDLHTTVAKMVFGIDSSRVRDLYYRHFSYRDIAKRAGHATNYYGTPFTISSVLKTETKLIERFQSDYFARFNLIRRWHHDIQIALQSLGHITTPLHRYRAFFGRRWDDATLREAIAFVPQSLVADILNHGLLAIYDNLRNKGVVLLGQIHDAILFQVPIGRWDLVEEAKTLMRVPVSIMNRTLIIPVEVKFGYNWANMVSQEKFSSLPAPSYEVLDIVL